MDNFDKMVKAVERGGVYAILLVFMYFGYIVYGDWKTSHTADSEMLDKIVANQIKGDLISTKAASERLQILQHLRALDSRTETLEDKSLSFVYLKEKHVLVGTFDGTILEVPMELQYSPNPIHP